MNLGVARLAGCLTLISAPLAAQAADAPFHCPELTRIGVSELGYSSYQEDGQIRGASVELAQQFGKRSGCKVEVLWFPRSRLFTEFQSGNVDLAMASVKTPSRDSAGVFVPYFYTVFDLLLSKQLGGRYTSLTDFTDHGTASLNLTRGSAFTPEVERQIERLEKAGRIEWVNDYGIAFGKLAIGRAAGTISSPIIYTWHMRQLNQPGQIVVLPLPEAQRQPVGIYLSRKSLSPAVRATYTRVIEGMVKDGLPTQVYGRFLNPAIMARLVGEAAR